MSNQFLISLPPTWQAEELNTLRLAAFSVSQIIYSLASPVASRISKRSSSMSGINRITRRIQSELSFASPTLME